MDIATPTLTMTRASVLWSAVARFWVSGNVQRQRWRYWRSKIGPWMFKVFCPECHMQRIYESHVWQSFCKADCFALAIFREQPNEKVSMTSWKNCSNEVWIFIEPWQRQPLPVHDLPSVSEEFSVQRALFMQPLLRIQRHPGICTTRLLEKTFAKAGQVQVAVERLASRQCGALCLAGGHALSSRGKMTWNPKVMSFPKRMSFQMLGFLFIMVSDMAQCGYFRWQFRAIFGTRHSHGPEGRGDRTLFERFRGNQTPYESRGSQLEGQLLGASLDVWNVSWHRLGFPCSVFCLKVACSILALNLKRC